MFRHDGAPVPPDVNFFDALENRTLLGADLPFTLYYPEGYVHAGISEFVPITNTNASDVQYELHARYETGDRDQLLASGTIAAHSRGGVTINTAGQEGMLARQDVPYALILKSSAPVAATLSHYDFGTAIGESFTDRTSTEWSFGEGFKDPNWTRDFVLFFNTSDDPADIRVIVYTDDGQRIEFDDRLGGQRRGGINLNNDPRIPNGVFGVQVLATKPIVAALSHYEIVTQRGFGALGTPDGGAIAGFISAADFDDRGFGSPDDDGTPDQGSGDFPGGGGGGGSGGSPDDDGTPDQGPGDFPGGGGGGGGGGSPDDDGTPDQGPGDRGPFGDGGNSGPGGGGDDDDDDDDDNSGPGGGGDDDDDDDDNTGPGGGGDDDDDDNSGPGGGGDNDDDDNSGPGGGGRHHDDDDDEPGRGRGHDRDNVPFPNNAFLTVLNTTDQTATVTFTFIPEDDDDVIANPVRTIQVPAKSRGGITIRDLGFRADDEFGVAYRSTVPVTVTAAIYEGRDAIGMEAVTVAATGWKFGEGFMSRTRAGRAVTEEIYLFNPSAQSATVTVEFFFTNGQVVTFNQFLSGLELEDVKVHARNQILALGENLFYGVRVTANRPIVATMEHWDRDLGGGFATPGIPFGTVVPLAQVLAL
ncbi:MAG TPA: hypothetical protein VD963_01265 [Phycisphaerales bacterium]|nr:hypothetical protein [Phycisphaerales bacterium]